jgi:hypothetical protein
MACASSILIVQEKYCAAIIQHPAFAAGSSTWSAEWADAKDANPNGMNGVKWAKWALRSRGHDPSKAGFKAKAEKQSEETAEAIDTSSVSLKTVGVLRDSGYARR